MTDSLEELGDVVPGTFRPFPGASVAVQHPRHYVVRTRPISEGGTFHIVVVGHAQPKIQIGYQFYSMQIFRINLRCIKMKTMGEEAIF